jgi:hypothetical protein
MASLTRRKIVMTRIATSTTRLLKSLIRRRIVMTKTATSMTRLKSIRPNPRLASSPWK